MPVPPATSMESSSSSTSSKAGEHAAAAPSPGGKAPKSPKVCGVCGDRAKSHHFGGISCDSCKAFFRRSVQNDAHRNFQCPYDQRCEITVSSRKCCQYCRFHKCLSIGMEKSWVMTEEERLQLLRQRMERKAKQATEMSAGAPPPAGGGGGAGAGPTIPPITQYIPDHAELHQYVGGNNQVALLRELVDKYEASYAAVPYPPQLMETAPYRELTILEMIAILITVIKRMTHFAGSLDVFSDLSENDRATLLRCSMIELCLIRAAYAYDPNHRCWPDTSKPLYHRSPRLRAEDLRRILPAELHDRHMKFNTDLQAMDLDETTFMLLIMVVMLSSERTGLQHPEIISQMQESYLLLLQRYMNWRYSPSQAAKLYPKVLLKLPDLRELSDAHIQTHLQLTQEDIEEFQHQFGNIVEGYSAEHFPETPWPHRHPEEPISMPPTQPPSLSFAEMQGQRFWLPYPLPLPRHTLPELPVPTMSPFIDPAYHLLLRPHHPESTSGNSTSTPSSSPSLPLRPHPRKPP